MIYDFGDVIKFYHARHEDNRVVFVLKKSGKYIYGIDFGALDSFDKNKILYLVDKGTIKNESAMTKQLDSVKDKVEDFKKGKVFPDRFYEMYIKKFLNNYSGDLFTVDNEMEMYNVNKVKEF